MKNFLEEFDFSNPDHLVWLYYILDQKKHPVDYLRAGYSELSDQEIFFLMIKVVKRFIWQNFPTQIQEINQKEEQIKPN